MTRLVIIDHFASAEELAACNACWPDIHWPGWVTYADQGGKRASDLFTPLPVALSVLLARMAAVDFGAILGIPGSVPDLSMRGGGLHEIQAAGCLPPHRDSDTHARLGLMRAWSAVLFLSRCDGGELWLEGMPQVEPLPGRLIAFDCRTVAHGVQTVREGERRSLAIFGYSPVAGPNLRPRADFSVG